MVLAMWWGLHKLAQSKGWADDRWYGAVYAALQVLHGLDVPHGPAWLQAAEKAFEDQYTKMHGQAPSADDLKAGVADMARLVGPQIVGAIGQAIADKAAGK